MRYTNLSSAVWLAVIVPGIFIACMPAASEEADLGQGHVTLINVNASINPGSADFIIDSISAAEKDHSRALIIRMDTPGGLVSSTREIVKGIMASKVPVIVYVAPDGAHAGSAGVFITLSANIAAMAPGTNIGAAHPVGMGGQDVEKEGKDMAKKVENDTVAFMEGIVEKRGRPKDWAVKAVRESVSITASAALNERVIDLVATSVEDLLAQVDGRQVKVGDVTVILKTAGVKANTREMSLKQKITVTFADPNIAYILFMIGLLGILMELYHPGVIFPGVIGGICLIMAFVSFQVLPINYGGLLLILLGVALFIAELYVTSHGILGIGGGVAVLIGSLLLVDRMNPSYIFDKEYGISMWTIIPTILILTAFFVFVGYVVLRSQRRKSISGQEGLLGEIGDVTMPIGMNSGKVFIHGEYWFAEADEEIPVGVKIRVIEVKGMTLKVTRIVQGS
jgi:membrane-bound serine protease (ClpP class)